MPVELIGDDEVVPPGVQVPAVDEVHPEIPLQFQHAHDDDENVPIGLGIELEADVQPAWGIPGLEEFEAIFNQWKVTFFQRNKVTFDNKLIVSLT